MANNVNLNIDLTAIPEMDFKDMYALYLDLFGAPNKSTRKEFYIWRITNRLQELRFGGLDARTKHLLESMPKDIQTPKNSYLPTGAEIVKKFKGETYHLRVLKEGFEFQGRIYKTLAGVAFKITGRKISGQEFFGV